MYPIPLDENLIEQRKCRQCSTPFPITDKDMEFYSKVSPVFPIISYSQEVSRNEVEDSPISETTRKLIAEGKIEIQEIEGIPTSTTVGIPFQKGTFLIPPPTLCPDCRQQRRLSHHNERNLYNRKCDATGKNIISIYSPDKPYTVYHQEYWWSDRWDPMNYGKGFDFSRSFFDQWKDFSYVFPKQALIAKDCENSDFVNFVWKVKNSYLISASSLDEDCYYGNRITKSKNCIDTLLVKESENCYSCIDVNNSYNCIFSEKLSNCRDCFYCIDCEGCSDCILSIHLRNKKYYINNQEYTKEEYLKKKEELKKLPIHELLRIQKDSFANIPRREGYLLNVDNSYGNSIRNTKNVVNAFDGDMLERVKYSAFVDDVSDAYDVNYGYGETRLQYESLGTGERSYAVLFSINVWPDISHMIYCDTCTGCHYCFGCIGLRNKSYCILNRQYSKDEYESLVPRIIEKMMVDREWGEFFPASLSPFGYNETVAQEYYPLTLDDVLGKGHPEFISGSSSFFSLFHKKEDAETSSAGPKCFLHGPLFNWSDYEAPFPTVEKIIPASKLPDTIEGIPDDILSWAIECEVSSRPFRIIRQELDFYRKYNIPIPRRHPNVRHMDRMKSRNPRKLFERMCDCERCEENWKMKGVILKEGMDASMYDAGGHIKNLPLSFSEGESDPERSSAIAKDDKNTPKNDLEILSGNQGKIKRLGKKMITTYAPERPETVYCEVCYEREVLF